MAHERWTNADLTLYHKTFDKTSRLDKYECHEVFKVLWPEGYSVNAERTGLVDADNYVVYVPRCDDAPFTDGDIIVRGICDKEISTDYPIGKLQKEHTSLLLVSVVRHSYGGKRLWSVELRGK